MIGRLAKYCSGMYFVFSRISFFYSRYFGMFSNEPFCLFSRLFPCVCVLGYFPVFFCPFPFFVFTLQSEEESIFMLYDDVETIISEKGYFQTLQVGLKYVVVHIQYVNRVKGILIQFKKRIFKDLQTAPLKIFTKTLKIITFHFLDDSASKNSLNI